VDETQEVGGNPALGVVHPGAVEDGIRMVVD
jgi:hypothetical protein